VDLLVRPAGFELRERLVDPTAEGFPAYVVAARKRGMDVNDYEEAELKWLPPLPILQQVVFPYLHADSIVCEIGPGTGRWSRHLAARLEGGQLHLVDHSPWMVEFLSNYFAHQPNVHAHLGNGRSLPFASDSWLDLIFASATFVELKLGIIYLYAREFARVLKPGGHAIFDYIDPTTTEGWQHLVSGVLPEVYTFHAPEMINRIFCSIGFDVVERHQIRKSTYIVVRKEHR
jgi:SAM-dependent methyltransferase